jgi:hypothetical protein
MTKNYLLSHIYKYNKPVKQNLIISVSNKRKETEETMDFIKNNVSKAWGKRRILVASNLFKMRFDKEST